MKKVISIVLAAVLALTFSGCGKTVPAASETIAESSVEETTVPAAPEETTEQETREGDGSDMAVAQQYVYELKENEDLFIEKTIFNEDVIIKGDYGQITFAYCDFNANIINESNEGTKVWIGEGNIFKSGCKCIFRNEIKEATMEYDTPKFMTWIPVEVVSEDCAGSATALNGVEINYNGEIYHIEDATLYMDEEHPENGMVPYEGQENANFLYVGKWYENGELQTLVLCEHVPM